MTEQDYRAESRRRWQAQADGWERRRDALRTATMPVSAWMIDALDPQPGQTLLELAAGTGDTGLLAAELIAPTGTLICSDFAPEMLAAARRRAEELGIANVRFKQIDLETSIDVPAASVDGVLCRWGYMLLTDPGTALQETRRVLRPGGAVALAAWAGPEHNPWSAAISAALVEHGLAEPVDPAAPGQFAWAADGAIAGALEAAGFADAEVEAIDFAIEYASAADWFDTQTSLSGRLREAIARAPDAAVAAVRAQLDEHSGAFADDDGVLRVPARTWVARAVA